MATIEIKVCDGCGIDNNNSLLSRVSEVIGQEYDGHRTEDEVVYVDLCDSCTKRLATLDDNIRAVYSIDKSRPFDKERTKKMLYLLLNWGVLKM